MNFNADYWDQALYSYVFENWISIVDCSYIYNSQQCYECLDTSNSYNCFFSNLIENCSNCYFCSDLIWCSYCYGSHMLRNTSYVWFWKQKTKEEWLELFSKYHKWQNFGDSKKRSKEISLTKPKKNLNITNSQNSVWDYISNSKNITKCFDVITDNCENSKFVTYWCFRLENVYDSNAVWGVELWYECNEGGVNVNHCCFIKNPNDWLRDTFYSVLCWKNSSNLFGCVWLRNKEYCIFNKQYIKEEYEKLVPKIIEHMKKTGEWWEYFSPSISLFWYNETLANEYFPLTKEEAVKQWFKWSDYEAPFPKVEKIIPWKMLPIDIKDIPDDVLNWAIKCEVTWRPFRIIKQELEFYRKHNLPIPRRHPDQRHEDRMKLRNPRKLFERKCDKCRKEIQTTYSPERPEIVYCEECYNKEVY
jgi:hypothetical protein